MILAVKAGYGMEFKVPVKHYWTRHGKSHWQSEHGEEEEDEEQVEEKEKVMHIKTTPYLAA